MRQPRRAAAGRPAADDDTQTRILEAARELAIEEGFSGFSVSRVAERAGVSRMTIYYQFGAKHELLEALFDHIAARGRLDRLGEVFQRRDALDALAAFITAFCGFWGTDPAGLRRLRGWAALEAAPGEGHGKRDEWRREGLTVLVQRIRAEHGVPEESALADTVDALHALTSFESYESLVRRGRSEREVAELLQRAALAIIGVHR